MNDGRKDFKLTTGRYMVFGQINYIGYFSTRLGTWYLIQILLYFISEE